MHHSAILPSTPPLAGSFRSSESHRCKEATHVSTSAFCNDPFTIGAHVSPLPFVCNSRIQARCWSIAATASIMMATLNLPAQILVKFGRPVCGGDSHLSRVKNFIPSIHATSFRQPRPLGAYVKVSRAELESLHCP